MSFFVLAFQINYTADNFSLPQAQYRIYFVQWFEIILTSKK